MTKQEWFDHLVGLGCICCALERWGECEPRVMAEQMLLDPVPTTIHHLKAIPDGPGMSQRSSWEYTIPLCPGHHEGIWPEEIRYPSIHQGAPGYTRPNFERRYGTEAQLWEYIQKIVAWKIKLESIIR